jgi:hypothetical protein
MAVCRQTTKMTGCLRGIPFYQLEGFDVTGGGFG